MVIKFSIPAGALLGMMLLFGCDQIKKKLPGQSSKSSSNVAEESSGDLEEESSDEGSDENESENPDSNLAELTYVDNIAPIMEASCLGAGCHSSPDAANGIVLDSYESVKTYIEASIASIDSAQMPIGKTISSEDVDVLKKWVELGMPETKTDGGTPPPSSAIGYAATVQPIMAVSCLGAMCHSGSKPKGGVALDTQQAVIDNFEGVLEAIADGSMPKGKKTAISQAQLDQLKQWQELGFPD
ncbi:MAG: hypothetical protein AB7T49_11185 [Oligoflexales bacterium]